MSSAPSEQAWSTVDAALRAIRALDRMETACFVVVSATTARYLRVAGTFAGLDEGTDYPRADSVIARVLDGAPAASSGIGGSDAAADSAEHQQLGVRSYVAFPVLRPDGRLLGVLASLSTDEVNVPVEARTLIRGIADALGAAGDLPAPAPVSVTVSSNGPRPAPEAPSEPPEPPVRVAPPTPQTVARTVRPGPPAARPGPAPRPGRPPATPASPQPQTSTGDMRLRRTSAGWVVEGPGPEVRPVGDLLSAMVLADLLADDLAPPGRPRRADRDLGEIEQLRLSVVQLEHALASRVIVEQAIGVLAERHQIRPREAFERLRRTARGMGRRVHELARQVVDSVGDPRLVLPGELGGRGTAQPPPPLPPPAPTGGAPRPSPPRPSATGRR